MHVALSHFGVNSVRGLCASGGTRHLDKRWKQLAKQNHPDRMKDARDKAEATRRMAAINEAREVLGEALRKFELQSRQESGAASRGASSAAFTSGASSASSSAFPQYAHHAAAAHASSSSAAAHVPRGFRRSRRAGLSSHRPSDILRQWKTGETNHPSATSSRFGTKKPAAFRASARPAAAAAPAAPASSSSSSASNSARSSNYSSSSGGHESQYANAEAQRQRRIAEECRRREALIANAKQRKNRLKRERDNLMQRYGRIKQHMCRFQSRGYPPHPANETKTPFYILDETDAGALDVDAGSLRALLQQLSGLAGCVQDDAVIAAKTTIRVMIQAAVTWMQKAHRDMTLASPETRCQYYARLLQQATGCTKAEAVASPRILRDHLRRLYKKAQSEMHLKGKAESGKAAAVTLGTRKKNSHGKEAWREEEEEQAKNKNRRETATRNCQMEALHQRQASATVVQRDRILTA